jgi:hypothetical protein
LGLGNFSVTESQNGTKPLRARRSREAEARRDLRGKARAPAQRPRVCPAVGSATPASRYMPRSLAHVAAVATSRRIVLHQISKCLETEGRISSCSLLGTVRRSCEPKVLQVVAYSILAPVEFWTTDGTGRWKPSWPESRRVREMPSRAPRSSASHTKGVVPLGGQRD